jgi:hypothetical protein
VLRGCRLVPAGVPGACLLRARVLRVRACLL